MSCLISPNGESSVKQTFSLCNSLQYKDLTSLKIIFSRSRSDITREGLHFSGSVSKCLQANLTNKEDVYSCQFIHTYYVNT